MMNNPDYNPELYTWQDTTVETPPKWMENRDLGFALEAAGDILRELTGRTRPDDNYIEEKTGRLERLLENPVDVEMLKAPLSPKDLKRADKLRAGWASLHGLSSRLKAVRDLNLALVDQNVIAAKTLLRRFKGEHERTKKHTFRRPTKRIYGPQRVFTHPGRVRVAVLVQPYRRRR